jgi:hypothetical protein
MSGHIVSVHLMTGWGMAGGLRSRRCGHNEQHDKYQEACRIQQGRTTHVSITEKKTQGAG